MHLARGRFPAVVMSSIVLCESLANRFGRLRRVSKEASSKRCMILTFMNASRSLSSLPSFSFLFTFALSSSILRLNSSFRCSSSSVRSRCSSSMRACISSSSPGPSPFSSALPSCSQSGYLAKKSARGMSGNVEYVCGKFSHEAISPLRWRCS